MGCGSSAKGKYAEGQDPKSTAEPSKPEATKPAEATDSKPSAAPTAKRSSLKATGPTATTTPKRRPSWSKQVEDTEAEKQHEGHIIKKEPINDAVVGTQRPSKVELNMEMWWMDTIPELYGVKDSEEMREALQEDAQAEKVKECTARPNDIASILKEWLHDCPDAAARDKFIEKVTAEVKTILIEKAPKTVSINASQSEDAPAAKRGFQRKGTGFVTAGQVRALMAADYSESEDEQSDPEQDDAEFERQVNANLARSGTSNAVRIAVSAERHTVPEDWKAPVFEKSADQKKRIGDAVSESFMFAALGFDQLQPVIDAFQEVRVNVGDKVIEEGCEVGPDDRGLYVLESGGLDVFKKAKPDEVVFTYNEMGQYFGDLALLYNAPRSATVIATKASVLWSIDRTTFNVLVKDAVQKAKERRLDFLRSVEILKTLSVDELSKIGDALRERTFGTGVNIIQEGTTGDDFFILEKGSAVAFKDGQKVRDYKPADYFGELALLNTAPRAADIKTLEDATVLSLNRKAFQRLLGPLDSIMQERAASYKAP